MSREQNKLPSVFLHEGQKYTQAELFRLLNVEESKGVRILKRLKEYGILKTVKDRNDSVDLTELTEEQIELAEVKAWDSNRLYVSFFVGVIMVEDIVLKCYPKYLPDMPDKGTAEYDERISYTDKHLKQVLKVLERFNTKEQIIHMRNETDSESSFNLLAVMLYLLRDYFDYGLYTNTREIVEVNGNGEILWDKTINETFTLLSNNRPYYPELLTRNRINNDYDYFRRLHACVLTECSDLMKRASLDKLLGIDTVDLSTEIREDFGDDEYILYRIKKELNVQYNTHKQLLLQTLYAYIANGGVQSLKEGFSMFGTNSFHVVWEKVCAEIFDNQLNTPLGKLPILQEKLPAKYDKEKTLKQLIDKPKWYGWRNDKDTFCHEADKTLIPDIISITKCADGCYFIIFDAKYYNMILTPEMLKNQPGIESITKQYLYHLAYKNFTEDADLKLCNCFLLPTADAEVINKGHVELGMMVNSGLEPIQIRLLPAEKAFSCYLGNKKYEICALDLYDCPKIKSYPLTRNLSCDNWSRFESYIQHVAGSLDNYKVKKVE